MSTNESLDESADISNLQESFTKQQKKISALKELVRKSEVAHGKSTSTAQEKVRNIAQRLTHMKFKARSRQGNEVPASSLPAVELPATEKQEPEVLPVEEAVVPATGSEKVLLLRQQMEHNKLRIAQRASSKQHLEQLVSQLKEKFDSTQQSLEDTTDLGKSMSDLSGFVQTPVQRERFKSATDLSTQSFSLEKERIKFLENRCRLLEKQLEKEKQAHQHQQLDNSLNEALHTVKRHNVELEEKIFELENALKNTEPTTNEDNKDECLENERLRDELAAKQKRVIELEEALDVSETLNFDLKNKLNEIETHVQQLQTQLEEAKESVQAFAPAPQHKNTDVAVMAEMAQQIQQLQDDLTEEKAKNVQLNESLEESEKLELSDVNIAEKIAALEATIQAQRIELEEEKEKLTKKHEEVMEKTIELNVLNANFKVLEEKLEVSNQNKQLFPHSNDENENSTLLSEIQQLKQKLDESNKAMIKLKLKCKQMEKLKKSTDVHAELINLQQKNEQLIQKITELEDEKGQWQLNQVDATTMELDEPLRTQLETIRLLEEQKYEQSQQLEASKEELHKLEQQVASHKETARVKTELTEIQWEEQLLEQKAQIEQLEESVKERDEELLNLAEKFNVMQSAKEELAKKVQHYVAENIELLDKVEKLSKSSSSAESIEIVERLTQQERAELAAYEKDLDREITPLAVSELTQTEMAPDLSESLIKLREESSELMNKIELFTNERREVLDKMETLTAENHELLEKIDELNEQREELETNALLAENSKNQLENQLTQLNEEKQLLLAEVEESRKIGKNATNELTSLQKTSEIVAALDPKEESNLFDKCEKSLAKLNSELEAYRRASDKNAKFNACKKLAKEAKNAHMQLTELLHKVKEASNAVETVTVVETVVAVTASDGTALAEYEQLTVQNRNLKQRLQQLEMELDELREESAFARDEPTKDTKSREEFKAEIKNYEKKCMQLNSEVERLQNALQQERFLAEQRLTNYQGLQTDFVKLQAISEDFDRTLNDKEMAFEQKLEKMLRLRNQLQDECDTYVGEIEVLQTLVKEQKQQLIEAYKENEHEMNSKLLELQQRDREINELKTELVELRKLIVDTGTQTAKELTEECEKLKEALRINKTLVTEQIEELSNKQETIDALNTQITELYRSMEDNAIKVIEKEDEIVKLQQQLDANNQELERLRKDNSEQQTVVDKLLNELHSHRNSLPQLEADVARLRAEKLKLEDAVQNLELKNKEQLDKLKKYAANLKKRVQQCQENETKIKELEKGALEQIQTKEHQQDTEELQILKLALQTKTMEELEGQEKLSKQQEELQKLQQKLAEATRETVQLQNALAATQMSDNQSILLEQQQVEIQDLRAKLQEHLNNEAELELQQSENDQLRMEVLLLREAERRERQAAEDLRLDVEKLQQLHNNKEMPTLLEAKVAELQTLRADFEKLQEELKNKSLKFEKSKAVIKERNGQIQRLQNQLQTLQQQLSQQPEEEEGDAKDNSSKVDIAAYEDLKVAHSTLQAQFAQEQQNFQQTIERLETLHAGIEAKLQEDMSYIESLEQDNAKYRDKVCKLEEAVAAYEERRASMERQASLLDAQMQNRADEYERHEDELVYRLNMLSEHDEIIAQRLLKTHEQKESLQEQMQQLQTEYATLSKEHKQLENDYKHLENSMAESVDAAQENLTTELAEKHALELQNLSKNYAKQIKEMQQQLEDQDNELSEQLQQLQTERRALVEQLERSKDEVVGLKEAQHALEQTKAELERESTWLRLQHENAQQDQFELQELRMQSMQDKTELENLKHQIDTLINNHNIELQALRTQISDLDTMRMQVGQNQTDDQVFIETENRRLTELLAEKQAFIEQLQQQQPHVSANLQNDVVNALQQELNALREGNVDMQRQLLDKNNELEQLRRQSKQLAPTPTMFFASNEPVITPFDEIVQAREVSHLESIAHPTIEDLQRNVCDLEKHAHELELKLATHKEQERRLQEALQQISVLQQEKSQLEQQLQQQKLEKEILPAPPTLDMFFGQTQPASEFEQLVNNAQITDIVQPTPVVEEIIVPKKAYICQPKHEDIGLELIGDDWGDSWAGNEELVTEAKNFVSTARSTSLLSQEQELNLQLQEAQDRIEDLQEKLMQSDTQKQELQVKSNKMLKKLKEYKLKLDNTASNNNFDDLLDAAIQDELKEQIKKLEARLIEQNKLQESLTAEKEKLLQRIDTLEAGNERMAEMKERQDNDVYMYQTRIRELQQQLQTDGQQQQPQQPSVIVAQATGQVDDNNLQQLKQQLQDANVEQQELHALLEEERGNVTRAEESLKNLRIANETTKIELNAAKFEYHNLQLQYQQLQQQYNELSDEHTRLQAAQADLQQQFLKLQHNKNQQDEFENLKQQLQQQQRESQITQLQQTDELNAIKAQSESTEGYLAELQSQLMELRCKNEELLQANEEMHEKLQKETTNATNEELQKEQQQEKEVHLQHEEELVKLKAKLDASESYLTELQSELLEARDKNAELLQINKTLNENASDVEKLQKQLASRLTQSIAPNDELMGQMAEKDSEIMHLKLQIENLMREDQTEKLVLEILAKNQEIHMLKLKIKDLEDDKQDLENNLSLQITQELQTANENTAQVAEGHIKKLEEQVLELQNEKSNMEEELQVLNNHVLQSLDMEEKLKSAILELNVKNDEVAQLRNQTKMANTDVTNWEAVLEQRCTDIAEVWRAHLEQREAEFKAVELQLQTQIESLMNTAKQQTNEQQQQQLRSQQTTGTTTPVSNTSSAPGSETSSATVSKDNSPLHRHSLRTAGDDSGDILEKMQSALESQEMEIITLKEQLAIRSAEYARLAAQYDPFNSSNPPTSRSSNETNGSTVPKSELDLALYMLHQRDMRCEEMTVELVQLLEERDTLQLKLSNTLRQVEMMKSHTQVGGQEATHSSSSIPQPLNVEQQQATTVSQNQATELRQKLSELQTVSHAKDKVIMEEREQRRGQMEKIHQDVAKIPSAAVSELVGTDLSQSNESPSTVLLNWLWGNKPATNIGNTPNN